MAPDKGWLQAVDALAKLKQDARRARLVMKGGTAEDHRGHFFRHASWLGLRTAEIHPASGGLADLAAALDVGFAQEPAILGKAEEGIIVDGCGHGVVFSCTGLVSEGESVAR